ncbi:MAG: dTDP-4-dehydrorhamnose reductase [Alphaproteobacteria bacterium]|nr:dTDP-4-dehydrorhamnose reductase [Hyphomonas sp.]MBR9806045.1 dTDP-4-dehydrorhamnose reductase [Alphaproteobacteria bacterium]|tara:strand:- start:2084 stop:2968 length:885 start_codon:yes stop_codon:yes gene_type:complete
MARYLVIGKSGQLAQALAQEGGADVYCAGHTEADLRDPDALDRALGQNAPKLVINAGAYTAVDKAEAEPDLCRAVNVSGPGSLARLCDARGIPLIHLSTDCVFDGEKATPYTPQDRAAPLCVYGQSKLDGERAVREVAGRCLIVRVSWIFSQYGSNFVTTMLRLAETRDEVSVVNDQYGCPTYAPALARAILQIAEQVSVSGNHAWGTYHLAGAGETDRATMAQLIYQASARHGGPIAHVKSIPTENYPTPARRPLNARLDMSDTTRVFGVELPDWEEGLNETVRALVKEMKAS